MKSSPIFVLGNRRSGTTLLRLMLTSHPDVSIPPEGGFVVALGWKYDRLKLLSSRNVENFVSDLFAMNNAQDWALDKDALLQRLLALTPCDYPTIVTEVYREYTKEKDVSEKRRWGDKTTWYLDYLPQIDKYFPDAQYIHIIRDGRAVTSSFKQVPHLLKDVREISLEWLWGIKKIRKFGKSIGPDRYREVRYEELVQNPEKELRGICDFIQELYDPEMMNFWLKNRQNHLEPERHLGWKALTLQDVTPSRLQQWRNELTNDEIVDFGIIAGGTMKSLAYEMDEVDVSLGRLWVLEWKKQISLAVRYVKRIVRPLKTRIQAIISNWAILFGL